MPGIRPRHILARQRGRRDDLYHRLALGVLTRADAPELVVGQGRTATHHLLEGVVDGLEQRVDRAVSAGERAIGLALEEQADVAAARFALAARAGPMLEPDERRDGITMLLGEGHEVGVGDLLLAVR